MSTYDYTLTDVTAVTVSYNSADVLAGCLDALNNAEIKTIVVDNDSSDKSTTIAKEKDADLVALKENVGFGKGMNAGVEQATTQFCLLINPDATINQQTIPALLKAAQENPNAVIIAPMIKEPDGRIFLLENSPLVPKDNPSARFVSGACMLVRRNWFEKQGGFDPNIFLFYEDDDICRRAWDTGHQVLYVPEAEVLHLRGQSVTPSFHHIYKVRYHQAWSRRYVCRKYNLRNPRLKLILINSLKLVFATLFVRKKRIARYAGSVMGNL